VIRLTPVTEKISALQKYDFYYIFLCITYVCSKWQYMDIVKNGFNAVKALTVTDFLKVIGVNR
jgi:hypothetical protein